MAIDDSVDYAEFEQDAQAPVAQSAVLNMAALGQTLLEKEEGIKRLEEKLKQEKESLRTLATETIVAAMDSANVSEFKTLDGRFKIEIKPLLEGSFPSAEKKPDQYREACQWLRDNEYDDLLKRYLTFSFPKGGKQIGTEYLTYDQICEKVKAAALQVFAAFGIQPSYEDEVTVHHMTLKAWAREMKEEEKQFPAETLGLWIGRVAKVKKC